jgi:hypothetical protein
VTAVLTSARCFPRSSAGSQTLREQKKVFRSKAVYDRRVCKRTPSFPIIRKVADPAGAENLGESTGYEKPQQRRQPQG